MLHSFKKVYYILTQYDQIQLITSCLNTLELSVPVEPPQPLQPNRINKDNACSQAEKVKYSRACRSKFYPLRAVIDGQSFPLDLIPQWDWRCVSINYAFLTFLHGPRGCIGQAFSRAELKVLLAAFVRVFEWTMADPEERVIPAIVITAKPKNGLSIKLKRAREW